MWTRPSCQVELIVPHPFHWLFVVTTSVYIGCFVVSSGICMSVLY